MHQPQIIQHLFQVSSLEDVSRERLEAFVEAYPSYGIGHYLLSCKLQAEGSDRFLPETQRTCLYFSNPLWLQWLLQNPDEVIATQPLASPVLSVVSPIVPEVEAEPVAGTVIEETHMTPVVEETYVAPALEETHTEHFTEETPAAPAETAEMPVENVVTMAEEAFGAPSASDDLAEALTVGGNGTEGGLSAAEMLLRSIEEARELREVLQNQNEDFTPETAVAGESLPAEPELGATTAVDEPVVEVAPEPVAIHQEPEAVHEVAAPQEAPLRDEETPFVLDEPQEEPPLVEEAPFILDEPEEVPVAEAPAAVETQTTPDTQAALEAPVAAIPVVKVTQDFLFEPYHTIDYFASQGIKFTLEENPSDKLGKQLKSFTEWLKIMRRLPQKDREVVPDRVMEEAIQTSAAHSVQGKDVLTETMAEVLAKQGMREKARAVYEKLSLLNPEKRAYFAAKIEQLNIS